jgi:hypothetical protein
MIKITQAHIDKINELLSYGLQTGLGSPEPGKMCVEAVICHALGLEHSDDPRDCVMQSLRHLKIRLNDSSRWKSNQSRAEGLWRLAIAQLGSAGTVDEGEFVRRVARMTIQTIVPSALRSAARVLTGEHPTKLLALAAKCETEPTRANAQEAYDAAAAATAYAATTTAAATAAAAYAAYAAAYAEAAYAAYAEADYADAYAADKVLADYAEAVVQILIDMDAPGCRWLAAAA